MCPKTIQNTLLRKIAIIEEIAEVLERRQKDKLSALTNVPTKK